MKVVFKPQFNCCHLIWMFHIQTLNNKINCLNERALRIAYLEYKLSFNELLQNKNSFTIDPRNISSLSLKIYKVLNGLSLSIMSNVFKENQSILYELRNCNTFRSRRAKSMKYGTETISYLAPKIWFIDPETIKNCKFLQPFKLNIRKWKPEFVFSIWVFCHEHSQSQDSRGTGRLSL